MENDKYTALTEEYATATDAHSKSRAGFHICHLLLQTAQFEKLYQFAPEVLELSSHLEKKSFYLALLNILGVACEQQGNFGQAKDYYNQMINFAQSINEKFHVALGNQNLALIAAHQSNLEEFFDLSFRAKDFFEKDPTEYAENLITLYLNLGERYKTLKKYDLAKEYMKKAYNIEKTVGPPARSYLILGNFYMETRDFTLALGYMKRSLKIFIERNDIAHSMNALFYISGQYYNTGKYERALTYLFQLQEFSQKYSSNKYDFTMYHYIGNSYYKLDRYEEAQKYFDICLQMISNIADIKQLSSFYTTYISFNETIKNYQKANEYYRMYLEVYKKEYDEQMQEKISVKTAEYELEQKKREAQLLAKKNKIIEGQNEELQKMQEAKDNLMYTISHDLKNMLGSVTQALEIAQIKDPSFKENKYIKMADTSNTRALTLVGEILYSSKLDASRDTVTLIPVDINTVIAEYEEQLNMRCKNKDITAVFTYADQPLCVMLDRDKWHRIFENLCTNAVKFTRPGGVINIQTKYIDNKAYISIKDNGIGIPPDDIPKLFVPFSKVGRKGTAGEESTGLGLSIVKKLVEIHNGSVDVTSIVGEGTEFAVCLPLVT